MGEPLMQAWRPAPLPSVAQSRVCSTLRRSLSACALKPAKG